MGVKWHFTNNAMDLKLTTCFTVLHTNQMFYVAAVVIGCDGKGEWVGRS